MLQNHAKKLDLAERIRMHRSRASGASNLSRYGRFCIRPLISYLMDFLNMRCGVSIIFIIGSQLYGLLDAFHADLACVMSRQLLCVACRFRACVMCRYSVRVMCGHLLCVRMICLCYARILILCYMRMQSLCPLSPEGVLHLFRSLIRLLLGSETFV